jgi:hypothetical protein
MSEKLAVVRRWVELYNERTDVTEFLSLLDPEVELHAPALSKEARPGGPDGAATAPIRWSDEAIDRALGELLQGLESWPTGTEVATAGSSALVLGDREVPWRARPLGAPLRAAPPHQQTRLGGAGGACPEARSRAEHRVGSRPVRSLCAGGDHARRWRRG